jgi:hypothetical protein
MVLVASPLALAAIGCSQNKSQPMDMGSSTGKPMNMSNNYACMMHPEVVSDKPGKCPKCGMDLTEKK